MFKTCPASFRLKCSLHPRAWVTCLQSVLEVFMGSAVELKVKPYFSWGASHSLILAALWIQGLGLLLLCPGIKCFQTASSMSSSLSLYCNAILLFIVFIHVHVFILVLYWKKIDGLKAFITIASAVHTYMYVHTHTEIIVQYYSGTVQIHIFLF